MSYGETLTKYEKFVNEMSVINITWKQCQQLVEKYDEKQARQSMTALDLYSLYTTAPFFFVYCGRLF